MSIERANTISSIILGTAFEAGSSALAATAFTLNRPIGALGGAIFGATRHLIDIPLISFRNRYLDPNHPQASTATRILAVALELIGSYGAAWAALSLGGFSLTMRSVLILSGVSILIESIALCFLELIGIRL
jgi:hypothetical protein